VESRGSARSRCTCLRIMHIESIMESYFYRFTCLPSGSFSPISQQDRELRRFGFRNFMLGVHAVKKSSHSAVRVYPELCPGRCPSRPEYSRQQPTPPRVPRGRERLPFAPPLADPQTQRCHRFRAALPTAIASVRQRSVISSGCGAYLAKVWPMDSTTLRTSPWRSR